jgi:hypothetical protein
MDFPVALSTLTPNPKSVTITALPKRHLILGEDRWEQGRPLVIIEGLMGYAAMTDKGIDLDVNIGALLGSFLTPEKAARIIDFRRTHLSDARPRRRW